MGRLYSGEGLLDMVSAPFSITADVSRCSSLSVQPKGLISPLGPRSYAQGLGGRVV